MKLVAGLGNPGKKYKNTRHNVGFFVVESIFEKLGIDKWGLKKRHQADIAFYDDILLAKPQTFMNSSGESVSSLANYYKIVSDDIFIIYDDLDLLLGEAKIQKAKGPKDHKGLNSIVRSLGSDNFWHVRIGIESRDKKNKTPGDQYVLEKFSEKEEKVVSKVIKNTASELLQKIKE